MTLKAIAAIKRVLGDALGHFNNDDGWAYASHVALSTLMAMFPFLIFLAAVAGMMDNAKLADDAVRLMFEAWPEEVAKPIAREVHSLLTQPRTDLLTIGFALTVYLAANGVEALRVALNRAYRVTESRGILFRRLQSLVFVVLGAISMLVLSFMVVLAPLAWATLMKWFPLIDQFTPQFDLIRYGIAGVVLTIGLIAVHLWLPDGRRLIRDVLPGVGTTLVLWLVGAGAFGYYLQGFADYASTYAGLASVMTALIFFYLIAVVFILGSELNAALLRYRSARARVVPADG